MDESHINETDLYLDHLRSGRKSPAVLKLKLAQIRATAPNVAILAFEGDDDAVVYSQWIARVRPMLQYEPFPCDGKTGVLMLRAVVLRDRSGLGNNVYFFLDRDFDDLRGAVPHESIFVTDRYSVENYLVSEEVVLELLKNEFHCYGRPDIREAIGQLFNETYDRFLEVTKEINLRIFVARKLGIRLKHQLPSKVGAIVRIELQKVGELIKTPEELVMYWGAPTAEQVDQLRIEFDRLEPRFRYRGKFALAFFTKWLNELVAEFDTRRLDVFADIDSKAKVRVTELVMSNFASKSTLPNRFEEFIKTV